MSGAQGVRFGVFADPHCCARPDDGVRFFSRAMDKTEQCFSLFAREGAAFAVCLGDLYDGAPGPQLDALRRRYGALCAQWARPVYLCPGNHDVTAQTTPDAPQWRTFKAGGVQFIVLDTCFGPDGVRYRAGNMRWDRLFAGPDQRRWLVRALASGTGPCMVLAHASLARPADGDFAARHVLGDAHEVRRILARSGRVRLVLQGHYHPGGVCEQDGIAYVTLPAIVDGERGAPAAVAECARGVCRMRLFDAARPGAPLWDRAFLL